jgi:alpha-tubulin suppressor-like RCC1 family protein
MYHPQTRPISTLPAAAIDLSSYIHNLAGKTGLPLPTPARLLAAFPGADLSALSRLLITQPLHVDTVAKAACEAIVQPDYRGPFGVEDIQRIAGFKTPFSTSSRNSKPTNTPWPSQQMRPASSGLGQRAFSTSSARRNQGSSSSESKDSTSKISVPTIAAAVALVYLLHCYSKSSLKNEAASLTQQELMRARSISQGVYAWGSNRYNVVAPDSPTTTFVKSPRSIPYFDGMALRDISMEERHGAAVDANGDVMQWGLGFFDSALEFSIQQGNLDDVPLGRRREKEKANEMTPRGSLGAQAIAPVKTLKGKNIVKLATSDTKIYALSKSGKVYVFSTVQARQWPGKKASWSFDPLTLFGAFASGTIDHEELKPVAAAKLASGEHICDIRAGSHHLLALSNKGRTFSAPLDTDGNAYGQLGTRRVVLGSDGHFVETVMEPRMLTEVEQRPTFRQAQVLPDWALPPGLEGNSQSKKPSMGPENRGIYVRTRTNTNDQPSEAGVADQVVPPAANIRYCTTLHEIPTLKGLQVEQIAAGSDHSIARTSRGQVLGWGRQTHGQTGLGAQIALEAVPVPTEIVLARSFANTSVDIHCTDITAGADNTFFTMSRREPGGVGSGHKIDVLAVGKGQWGTLGNAMWSQVTLAPVKVKTVSSLIEFSESTGQTHPVPMHTITVGKPGSVAVVLDTVEHTGHQAFGRDVMVFGHNAAYQLGTTKRSNLCIPQHLHPLPPPTPSEGAATPEHLPESEKLKEADINSGVLTHMPHSRLQLASKTKADTKVLGDSPDEQKKVKRNVEVEESITAGAVSMAVYWKIFV